jgi:hypothetical protein
VNIEQAMSKATLNYLYVVLGTGFAVLGDRLSPSETRRKQGHETNAS